MIHCYKKIEKAIIEGLKEKSYSKEDNAKLVDVVFEKDTRSYAEIMVNACEGKVKNRKKDKEKIQSAVGLDAEKWCKKILLTHADFYIYEMEHGWRKADGTTDGADYKTNYYRKSLK